MRQYPCQELSDLEIIRKSLEDVEYFSCLYERYEKRLLVYIMRFDGVTKQEAEDVLQESFIKIWRNLHAFDQDLKLSSWIYRIVHNHTISTIRKKTSYGKYKIEPLRVKYLNSLISPALKESELLEEQIQCVHKVIDLLSMPYKEVMVLRYLENMSYEEISDVLQIPEGTVATRINRAKKAFRRLSVKCPSLFDLSNWTNLNMYYLSHQKDGTKGENHQFDIN